MEIGDSAEWRRDCEAAGQAYVGLLSEYDRIFSLPLDLLFQIRSHHNFSRLYLPLYNRVLKLPTLAQFISHITGFDYIKTSLKFLVYKWLSISLFGVCGNLVYKFRISS